MMRSLAILLMCAGLVANGLAVEPQATVQVLQAGFEVFELPITLPNLNNVRYRADGQLYALGYNGNVWLLRDTNRDGLEDTSHLFFENKAALRGPIGMAVVPSGHELLKRQGTSVATARGVIVASKGKVSALLDYDGDDVAETERVIASGWKEIPPNVDTIGVAIHPVDGSIYFGLGTAAYNNAYLLDQQGKSQFDLASERGTVQRIKPDLSGRETVSTGVRFTIGLEFNQHDELFATEQEGATWLPNGNPFDELLHIRPGRHYGFPPRHPRHLPNVFDEPSLFDYRPQHQSTCGMVFNLPRPPLMKTFGPSEWTGNAFVTGESRGKIYRTTLMRTRSGDYVASSEIFAALSLLTVDCTLTPAGHLLVCCHSGGPDWGTGPNGEGKVFVIRAQPVDVPRVMATWASGPNEMRVAFDRAVAPESLKGLTSRIEISAGPYVAAGDRFEVIRPGYEVVKRQRSITPQRLAVYSASLTPDHRTLVLATAPQTAAVQYAIRLSGLGREKITASPGSIPQEPDIDLAYSLSGVAANWTGNDASLLQINEPNDLSWRGVIPHLDSVVWQAMRADVPETSVLLDKLSQQGTLTLTTLVDSLGLFLPETQPGSQLDFAPQDDKWISARNLRLSYSQPFEAHFREQTWKSTVAAANHVIVLELPASETELLLLKLVLPTGGVKFDLDASWQVRFANETERSGPLPLHRLLVPWARRETTISEPPAERSIPELVGANWGRGRHVFRSEQAACSRCHVAHGEGNSIGPDLSNLIHRDYESVVRDIRHPSFAINPDFITYAVQTRFGQVLTGVVRSAGDELQIADSSGKLTKLRRDEVEQMRASTVSIMPEGVVSKLSEQQWRDLMAYLMFPPPHMPTDGKGPRPEDRSKTELAAVLANSVDPVSNPRQLRLLLIAGKKDHGPGEHDYPAWLTAWSQILSAADGVSVDIANEWPTPAQIQAADTLVVFQKGSWSVDRAREVDKHLNKGGGLVLIHWAVEGGNAADQFAQRIGLASNQRQTKYRHGPLSIDWSIGKDHPIARNLTSLSLVDESYWNLVADSRQWKPLAYGATEDGNVRPPLFWTVEHQRGRVFVSIPGHYSWTFDDPIFRVVLFRAIAWCSREPVDRFNAIVPLGVRFAASAPQ